MKRRRFIVTAGAAAGSLSGWGSAAPPAPEADKELLQFLKSDPILSAIYTELARFVRGSGSTEPAYFTEVSVDDARLFTIAATLGAAYPASSQRVRPLRISVRIGRPEFDNTNSVYSDFSSSTRYDSGQLPIDDAVLPMRNQIWLGLDRAHRSAIEGFGRKKASVGGITVKDPVPDFWPTPRLTLVETPSAFTVDRELWTQRVKSLSAVFAGDPATTFSSAEFNASIGNVYVVNTIPTVVRVPDAVFSLRIRGGRQAADGMTVYDGTMITAIDPAGIPPENVQREAAEKVARNIRELAAAPVGEPYTGPILFEGAAASQVVAQIWGEHLGATRRPVAEPGRNVPFVPSELENRLNARVLPDWVSLTDDPLLKEMDGVPLAGHYRVDMEGVPAQKVEVVKDGILKSLLVSRQPVRGMSGPNGHARLPGNFGVRIPRISNLLFEARGGVPEADLRRKLIETATQMGRPYAIVIRKIDFPSFAPADELRRIGQRTARSGGNRAVAPPVLVYRVYPDGREELIRGLRFRGLGLRSFRDILAAGDARHVYNYMDNGAPLALSGAGSFVVGCSVTAPSLLLEEVELEVAADDLAKPPIVPPPASA